MSISSQQYDAILEQLQGEYIDEAEDNLNAIDIIVENGRSEGIDKENVVQIRRFSHSLKGSSGVADFPLVAMVMHMLEDFLAETDEVDKGHCDALMVFSDVARQLVSGELSGKDGAAISRLLPNKRSLDASTSKQLDVMMVIKDKIAGQIFERALSKYGLRVNTVNEPFYAIEMAVRTQPDLVIMAAVLDTLSGIDLARAIRVIESTSNIPIAVLTSFEAGHAELERLPKSIKLIQKNNLESDLDTVLKDFNLAA